MKTAGIIAEYNPFHNGHKYHIDETKRLTDADCTVVIMSGDFTQRGFPASFDKWTRASMAIDGGADLVIELPFIYACSSSQEFAAGGTGILHGLGCIDDITFGAETDDRVILKKTAEACADQKGLLDEPVKGYLSKGMSYPKAFSSAVGDVYGNELRSVLDTPNNLLAVEYIKSLILKGSDINITPVQRTGAAHDDHEVITGTASGTAIRKLLDEICTDGSFDAESEHIEVSEVLSETVPDSSLKYINKARYTDSSEVKKRLFELLKYKITTTSAERLSEIYSVDEGIENRIRKHMLDYSRYADAEDPFDRFIDDIKSKRFTYARIQRMLMYILMDLTDREFQELKGTYYARVLGFSSRGAKLLKMMTESSEIPVFTNMSQASDSEKKVARCLELDSRAADLYSIVCKNGIIGEDKKHVPYILGMNR